MGKSRLAFRLAVFAMLSSGCAYPDDPGADPFLILNRARAVIARNAAEAPHFTCRMYVTRSTYVPVRPGVSPPDLGDPQLLGRDYRLTWTDKFRLDLADFNGTEMFSWPGERPFETRPLEEIVGGPIGTGDFVSFPVSVLLSDSGPDTIRYGGAASVSGHKAARYFYRVPTDASHYSLKTEYGYEPAAYTGYFLVDEEAADIRQLVVEVPDPPVGSHIRRTHLTINYARSPIGRTSGIVPKTSTLLLLLTSGTFSENRTAYENCQEFSSESILRFDSTASRVSVPAAAGRMESHFKAGLEIETQLTSHIDSNTVAAGDSVEARVTRDVKDRGALLIHSGARVFGRVIFVRQNWFPDRSFWITVRLDSIELAGKRVQVHLGPAAPDNSDFRLSPRDLSDVKNFWTPDKKEQLTMVFQGPIRGRVRLGKQTVWRWRTR